MRSLTVPLLTAFLLVIVGAKALGRYGRHHHLPQQQMNRALAAGDGCLLFLGDSRMVAGLDEEVLHQSLAVTGADRCIAPLAIGATGIDGAYLTARQYLLHGRLPKVVVLGKVGDSLLGAAGSTRPEEMVGNNVIHLTWSTADDVFAEAPGFPGRNIDVFDRGFRFLVGRSTALGQYQSLVSARVQQLQSILVGGDTAPKNRFGAVGDMASLEADLRAGAAEALSLAMLEQADRRYGPWFRGITDLFRARRVPILIVELPMRDLYRRTVTHTAGAEAYERWLQAELERNGDRFLDLSEAPWIDDGLFVDKLHLGPEGAKLVSAAIGQRLSTMLRGRGP